MTFSLKKKKTQQAGKKIPGVETLHAVFENKDLRLEERERPAVV